MTISWEKFRNRLDQVETWPCDYTFKFILPASSGPALEKTMVGVHWSIRPSSGGKYLSYTFNLHAQSSQHIIDIYQRVGHIPGLISL